MKRGLTSASTPEQNVGCTVHAGELWKPTCESVMLLLHATSNVRGPCPHVDLFVYHGHPPPSTMLVFWSAPITATLVRFVPHRMAVGPVPWYRETV